MTKREHLYFICLLVSNHLITLLNHKSCNENIQEGNYTTTTTTSQLLITTVTTTSSLFSVLPLTITYRILLLFIQPLLPPSLSIHYSLKAASPYHSFRSPPWLENGSSVFNRLGQQRATLRGGGGAHKRRPT